MAKVTITLTDTAVGTEVECTHEDVEDGKWSGALEMSKVVKEVVYKVSEAIGGVPATKVVGRRPAAGTRVGALRSLDDGVAFLYGFGVYEGEFPIGDDDGPQPKGNTADKLPEGTTNPRIRLDNGQVIWGCECWFGPEEEIKEQLKGMHVIRCNISSDRVAFQAN